MEIIEQKNNQVLHREEINFLIESVSTPSIKEVAKLVSEKFKKPEENIVVTEIIGNFGRKKFSVSARIYDSHESKKKYEVIPRKQRKKDAKEAAEKKAEEAKKIQTQENKPEEK